MKYHIVKYLLIFLLIVCCGLTFLHASFEEDMEIQAEITRILLLDTSLEQKNMMIRELLLNNEKYNNEELIFTALHENLDPAISSKIGEIIRSNLTGELKIYLIDTLIKEN